MGIFSGKDYPVKCFEMTGCSEKDKSSCLAWTSFKENPAEMENIHCWVIKGAFHTEENIQKCRLCSYYQAMNPDSGIASEIGTDAAVITCKGTINSERCAVLEKIWKNLKQNGKFKVVLDFSGAGNIYSCGLGLIVKIHKEAQAGGGSLIVSGARGNVLAILTGTKLIRIVKFASDKKAAIEYFEQQRIKQEAIEREAAEKLKMQQQKKRIPCWEFWKNHNPRNATKCDECFTKASSSSIPCWIIEGMIEGISFQYVNEECEGCDYFKKFAVTEEKMPA